MGGNSNLSGSLHAFSGQIEIQVCRNCRRADGQAVRLITPVGSMQFDVMALQMSPRQQLVKRQVRQCRLSLQAADLDQATTNKICFGLFWLSGYAYCKWDSRF